MMQDLPVDRRLTIPACELSYRTSRAGGPGGQHVNTTDTRIQIRWNAAGSRALGPVRRERLLKALAGRLTAGGELVVACDSYRSQRRNLEEARRRLADLVRGALAVPRPRKATAPSPAAERKRLQDKKRHAQVKKGRARPQDGE